MIDGIMFDEISSWQENNEMMHVMYARMKKRVIVYVFSKLLSLLDDKGSFGASANEFYFDEDTNGVGFLLSGDQT